MGRRRSVEGVGLRKVLSGRGNPFWLKFFGGLAWGLHMGLETEETNMKTMKSVLTMTATLSALLSAAAVAGAEATRSYSAAHFVMELEGQSAGALRSVEGGGASAVIGTDGLGGKQVVLPKYDDYTVEVGLGSSGLMNEWIAGFVNGQAPRKDGAIIAADFNYKAQRRAEFGQALITEVTVPKLDGSSKDPGALTVKITPYISALKKGGGETVKAPASKAQKLWLPSNFRLEIGGLECKRVAKIDAFTIKQSLEDIGEVREYQKVPGKIEYPNLKLSIAQADLDSWLAWYENFLVKAQNADSDEKDGTLTFLASNLKDEIGRIELKRIGLVRLTPFLREANADAVARFEVELYVEEMKLQFAK